MSVYGILAGLVSAILQSCAYVSSAVFLERHRGRALDLLCYTQLVQAVVSLPVLLAMLPGGALGDWEIWRANLYWLSIFCITQYSMFFAQRTVEPSKIATWLGLKIAVLALLTSVWPLNGETVNAWQWGAIAVTIAAVWLLNTSGGRRTGRAGFAAILVFIFVASLCDREQVFIMNIFQRKYGVSMLVSGLLTLTLGYVSFGVVALGYVLRNSLAGEAPRLTALKLRDSSPFAFFWFTAMIAIYFCYGELGPVFGNVVQSTRAVLSVTVGFLAFRCLGLGVEVAVPGSMWLRRLLAASMMTAGIVLYSLFR